MTRETFFLFVESIGSIMEIPGCEAGLLGLSRCRQFGFELSLRVTHRSFAEGVSVVLRSCDEPQR